MRFYEALQPPWKLVVSEGGLVVKFYEALQPPWKLVDTRWVFAFGREPGIGRESGEYRYTLELEPMVGGGFDVAIYEWGAGRQYPNLLLPAKLPLYDEVPRSGLQLLAEALREARGEGAT